MNENPTPTPTVPPTPQERQGLRDEHRPDNYGECIGCGYVYSHLNVWPCVIIRTLNALEAVERELVLQLIWHRR